mgnify:CR=1 FL=1
MIEVKDGVVFKRLSSEIMSALRLIEPIFTSAGVNCVITSANDSKHMGGSLHYKDRALDLRSKHLPPGSKLTVRDSIAHALGSDYQVLLENEGGVNEHFHVEYDPPKGKTL